MKSLKIDILTLFPDMFEGPLSESLIGKAIEKKLLRIRVHDLRDFTKDKHRRVDDKPFGGGPGMVIRVEPIYNALKKLSAIPESKTRSKKPSSKPYVVFLSPQGKTLNQETARRLSQKEHLVLVCGHYEGIDERSREWVDEEISIGDYVLTGGELPAMVLVDTVSRLRPGVVKEQESVKNDSFSEELLDHSHYTRPAKFLDLPVPQILLSGNHQKIQEWRLSDSVKNTLNKRPDLMFKNSKSGERGLTSLIQLCRN